MITILVPAHNESDILEDHLAILNQFLETSKLKDVDVLVVNNKSTDNTLVKTQEFIESNKLHNFSVIDTQVKGVGHALKMGTVHAKTGYVLYYAMDLPFGLNILKDKIEMREEGLVVIGSKSHPESRVNRSPLRTILSYVHYCMNRILLGLKVKDPTGSILFYKDEDLNKRIGELDSDGAFYTIELLLLLQNNGRRFIEIPVILNRDIRPSKINVIKDGLKFLNDILSFKSKK